MPGYVVHIAIAQEYLKKHKQKYSKEFIEGSIAPDFTKEKSKTHYGKSPAYTSLKNYLKENSLTTEFDYGFFLHLVTDYLFYNYYLDFFEKPQIYNDYDYTNQEIIEKYQVILPEKVKDQVFFKKGQPKIFQLNLAYKVIDEISSLDLKEVEKQVINNEKKWSIYKNLI